MKHEHIQEIDSYVPIPENWRNRQTLWSAYSR